MIDLAETLLVLGSRPAEDELDVVPGRVLLNATIEPDADADGYGDETQDHCPGPKSIPCATLVFGVDPTPAGMPGGAVTQVVNYVQFPALSIAITASILAAQAIGAGATERLGAILRTGLWLNVAITGGFVLLGYALSHALLGLFLTDEAVRVQGEHLLHIMLWSLLVFGFQAVLGGIMRASGDVLVPTGITIFCILVVQMGVAWVLNCSMGLEGIWIAFPVAYLAMLALQTTYFRVVWRHRKIERLV